MSRADGARGRQGRDVSGGGVDLAPGRMRSLKGATPDFAARVSAWQVDHGRSNLPWQRTRDPYRVWLSEIMLQQTQVSTVLDFYPRFVDSFPDVHVLAAASLDDVLALWSGMGYYSRARNLHRCAVEVVQHHAGRFPSSSQALAELPGIGESTAAAIAAFCFGERAAILDGNVKRVLTRHIGFAGDLSLAAPQRELWRQARERLPHQGIATYTQGLMDLGATVCTRRQPACLTCPVALDCVARHQGLTSAYPVKTRRLKRGRRDNVLLWLAHAGGFWLVRRPSPGVWAGLWCLPQFAGPDDALLWLRDLPGEAHHLPAIDHALTHFDWHLRPLRWQLPAKLSAAQRKQLEARLPGPARWFSLQQALALGLPAPVRRLLEGPQNA